MKQPHTACIPYILTARHLHMILRRCNHLWNTLAYQSFCSFAVISWWPKFISWDDRRGFCNHHHCNHHHYHRSFRCCHLHHSVCPHHAHSCCHLDHVNPLWLTSVSIHVVIQSIHTWAQVWMDWITTWLVFLILAVIRTHPVFSASPCLDQLSCYNLA